jgi:hypothetical protein
MQGADSTGARTQSIVKVQGDCAAHFHEESQPHTGATSVHEK